MPEIKIAPDDEKADITRVSEERYENLVRKLGRPYLSAGPKR